MDATFRAEGTSVDYVPAVAVAAGAIVALGDMVGIAKAPIPAGETGSLALEGEFEIVKDDDSGPVFAFGDMVFWDVTNSLAVRTGGPATLPLGPCTKAAATGDDSVWVNLTSASRLPAALQGKVWEDVSLASGSKVLDAQDTGKVINITAGSDSNVVTLPAVGAGLEFVIRAGVSGERVAISPNASDGIHGPDLSGTDDADRILAALTALAGDYIALHGGLAAGFVIHGERGAWAQA